MNQNIDSFGLIVVGDEILLGKRRDRHFEGIRERLERRGYRLAWFQVIPDEPEFIVARLRESMAAAERVPVFSCGGIGATPDDHTRQCAAEAAGVPLIRHPGAVAEIEGRFGEESYPHRILMAELPEGSELIPNPYNRIPGFSINHHYFMPGFPDMAHPMADWVLDTHYPAAVPERELSLKVREVTESRLLTLMDQLVADYPQLKLFSLPRLGDDAFIELGFRGREGLDMAFARLQAELRERGFLFELHQD